MQFDNSGTLTANTSLTNRAVFEGGKLLYGRSLDNIIAKLSKERVFKKRNRILLVSERSNACLSLSSDDEQDEKSPDLHQCGQCHRMFSSLSSYITHRLERPCCVRNNVNRYVADRRVDSLSPLENHRVKDKVETSDQEEDANEFIVQEIHKRKHDRKGTARKLQAGALPNEAKSEDGVRVFSEEADLGGDGDVGDRSRADQDIRNGCRPREELIDSERTPRVYTLGDEEVYAPSLKESEHFDQSRHADAERRGDRAKSGNDGCDIDADGERQRSKDTDRTAFSNKYSEGPYPENVPPRFAYTGRQSELPPPMPFYEPGHGGPLGPTRFRGPVPYSFLQGPPSDMEYQEMYRGGRAGEFGGPYPGLESGMEKPPSYVHDMRSNNMISREYGMFVGGRYKDRYRPPPLDFQVSYSRFEGESGKDSRGASHYHGNTSSPPDARSREPLSSDASKMDHVDGEGIQAQASSGPQRSYTRAVGEPSASEEKVSEGGEERQEQAPQPNSGYYRNYGSGGPPELVRIPTPQKGQASYSPGESNRISTNLSEERTPSSMNMNEEQSKSSTYSLSPSSSGKNTEQGSSNVSSPALPESNPDGSPYDEIAVPVTADGQPRYGEKKDQEDSLEGRNRSHPSGSSALSPPPLQLPTFARLSMNKGMTDDGPSDGGKDVEGRMSKSEKYSMVQDDATGDPSWRHAKQVYRCPLCAKIFPFKSKLQRHVLVHTGIKPYKCTVCGRGFTQQIDLQRHVTRHTGEKPFKCHLCKAQFIRADNLRKHAKDTHFVNIEEPVRKRRRKTTGSDTVLPPLEVAIAMAINEAEKNGGRILGRSTNKFPNSRFEPRPPTMNERAPEKFKGDAPPDIIHRVSPRGQMMVESQVPRSSHYAPEGMPTQPATNRYPGDPYKDYRGDYMRYPPNFSPAREMYGPPGRYGYLPSPGREKAPPWAMSRPPSLISPGDVAKYANELRTKRERLESSTSEGASVIVENEGSHFRPSEKEDDEDSRQCAEGRDVHKDQQQSPKESAETKDCTPDRESERLEVNSNFYDGRRSQEKPEEESVSPNGRTETSPNKLNYSYEENVKFSSDRNHPGTLRGRYDLPRYDDDPVPMEVTIVKDASPSMDAAYQNLPNSVIDSSEVK